MSRTWKLKSRPTPPHIGWLCWLVCTVVFQGNTLTSSHWRTCCVSNQGLHPSKDPAFAVFEGESFRETLLTAVAFGSCHDFCHPGPQKWRSTPHDVAIFSLSFFFFGSTKYLGGHGVVMWLSSPPAFCCSYRGRSASLVSVGSIAHPLRHTLRAQRHYRCDTQSSVCLWSYSSQSALVCFHCKTKGRERKTVLGHFLYV